MAREKIVWRRPLISVGIEAGNAGWPAAASWLANARRDKQYLGLARALLAVTA